MGWTVREFLEKNVQHVPKKEKTLLAALRIHAGEKFCVPRGVGQQLSAILKTEKFPKNILERRKHIGFIDKVRSCVPTPKDSPVGFMKQQQVIEASKKCVEKPVKVPKRKPTEDLSKSGKRYRLKRLGDVIDKDDLKLINEAKVTTSKVDPSKALNYVYDAHMSSRDMETWRGEHFSGVNISQG